VWVWRGRASHIDASDLRLIPPASIVIPTRNRPDYLAVALASIAPQAAAAGAEVVVVDDGGASAEVRALAERHGARYEPHPAPLGLNVARNTGVARSRGELVAFVDDDVEVRPGWLQALLDAAREHPETQVFTGPIRARLEGGEGWTRRSCGREAPPITALDLGASDTTRVRYAWGANMAVRRAALEEVGPFDVRLGQAGDEQEWQDRLLARCARARAHAHTRARAHLAENNYDTPPADPTAGNPDVPPTGDAERGTPAEADGPLLYVAKAALDHRRSPEDARLGKLLRAAHARGRAARRFDGWRARNYAPGPLSEPVPSLTRELLTLAGCGGHVVRRRCPRGLTMVAHSAGRLHEALAERRARGAEPDDGRPSADGGNRPSPAGGNRPAADGGERPSAGGGDRPSPAGDDFLSGESGTVGGLDALRRELTDRLLDAGELLAGRGRRLDRAARGLPRRRVLALAVARPEHGARMAAIAAELGRSRHEVELHTTPPGGGGKFENLNGLLAAHPVGDRDWLLVIDDDVVLPRGFLDRLLLLAERFSFDLVQPAHRARSHAAWRVTRRRPGVLARQTGFVEIGPVTAFSRETFSTLLPFPELRMGWGLDLHWAALARARGWRCGVLDAVAIAHMAAPAAQAYSREQAVAEARELLARHPYLPAGEAQLTLATHRRL